MYLQGLLKKAAKSGRKLFVRNLAMRDMWPPLLQCYNVTCYMLHVTLRRSHCALPPRAGRVERAGGGLGRRAGATGVALAGGQEGDRSGLGRRARGIVARIGENVFVAVVFAVRSALLLTFLLFSDVVRKKKRNFAIDI